MRATTYSNGNWGGYGFSHIPQPMVKEAAGAGLYEGPTGKVPKIQLFTIEDFLGGKRPRIPLIERAFKVTEGEDMEEQDELDL
jgi:hypothetical protein